MPTIKTCTEFNVLKLLIQFIFQSKITKPSIMKENINMLEQIKCPLLFKSKHMYDLDKNVQCYKKNLQNTKTTFTKTLNCDSKEWQIKSLMFSVVLITGVKGNRRVQNIVRSSSVSAEIKVFKNPNILNIYSLCIIHAQHKLAQQGSRLRLDRDAVNTSQCKGPEYWLI